MIRSKQCRHMTHNQISSACHKCRPLFFLLILNSSLEISGMHNTIFLEAGGPGGLVSINYELNFKKMGVHLGYGSFLLPPVQSIPFGLSYFVGNGNHKLELGLGATRAWGPPEDNSDSLIFEDFIENIFLAEGFGPEFLGNAIIAYRYQRVRGPGPFFRAGFTPIYTSSFFAPWFSVAVGVSF